MEIYFVKKEKLADRPRRTMHLKWLSHVLITSSLLITALCMSTAACSKDMGDALRSGVVAAKAGHYSKAATVFQEVAENGTKTQRKDAEFNLGRLYYEGHGVEQSSRKAMQHYDAAASLGSSRAIGILASFYTTDDGGPPQWNRAMIYMGTALAAHSKINFPDSLKQTILQHFDPKKAKTKITLRNHPEQDSSVSGFAHKGDWFYVADVQKQGWVAIFVDRADDAAVGFATEKSVDSSLGK